MDVGRAVKAPAAPFYGVIYQVSRWVTADCLVTAFKWSYMLSGRDISPLVWGIQTHARGLDSYNWLV